MRSDAEEAQVLTYLQAQQKMDDMTEVRAAYLHARMT